MTRPPIDKPLAKAESHLQAGRIAQAVGAFRAVLLIDPAEVQAHFGLAECALARDCTEEAIAGLVTAATELGAGGRVEAALHLYAGALTIDPERLELHVDVAEVEIASGRPGWASARLHALARAYQASGRADEAAAIEEFAAGIPGGSAPTDEACIVELPAPVEPTPPPATMRRGVRRGAPRWQPVGSPGRTSKDVTPPPPPRKALGLRPLPRTPRPGGQHAVPPPPPQAKKDPPTARARVPSASHAAVAVAAKKKAPAAPSPLAQRLRMREAATPAPRTSAKPTTKRTTKPTSREDLKRRLASSLAAVKAKHKPGGSAKTLAPTPDTFEDERTVLFRRPA